MDEIKIHYNKTATNIRHNDDIGNASKVHNWIKSLLINRFCSYDSTIIDIGCGRGGDVKKYKKSNVKLIVGIDLSDKSLVQMENRYKKESILFQLKCADACAVEFPSDVDAVVANFSFHYFFDGREPDLIDKIYKSLKKEGFFWGIVTDCRVLTSKSDLFEIEIEKKTSSYTSYMFTLGDSVSECIESVIEVNDFESKCNIRGFKTIILEPLDVFIDKNSDCELKKYFNITQLYPQLHSIYTVFCFQKI